VHFGAVSRKISLKSDTKRLSFVVSYGKAGAPTVPWLRQCIISCSIAQVLYSVI